MKASTVIKKANDPAMQSWHREIYIARYLEKFFAKGDHASVKELLQVTKKIDRYALESSLKNVSHLADRAMIEIFVNDRNARPDHYLSGRWSPAYFFLSNARLPKEEDKKWLTGEAIKQIGSKDLVSQTEVFPVKWRFLSKNAVPFQDFCNKIPWEHSKNQEIFSQLLSDYAKEFPNFTQKIFKNLSDKDVEYSVHACVDLSRQHQVFPTHQKEKRSAMAAKNILVVRERIKNLDFSEKTAFDIYKNIPMVQDPETLKSLMEIFAPHFEKLSQEKRDLIDVVNVSPRGIDLCEKNEIKSISQDNFFKAVKSIFENTHPQISMKGFQNLINLFPKKDHDFLVFYVFQHINQYSLSWKNIDWLSEYLPKERKLFLASSLLKSSGEHKRSIAILTKNATIEEMKTLQLPPQFSSVAEDRKEWLGTKIVKKSKKEIKETIKKTVKSRVKSPEYSPPKRRM